MPWTGGWQHTPSLDHGRPTRRRVAFLLVFAIAGAGILLLDEVLFEASFNRVISAIGVATFGSLLALGVMFYRLHRETRRRASRMAGADAALRYSEHLFRQIFQDSPLGIVLASSDHRRIVQANPAFCRLLGFTAAALAGQDIAEVTHVDDRGLLTEIGSAERPWQFVELRFVTRSGALAWCRLRVVPLNIDEGSEKLLLVLAEDITRQKRIEAELRQAQKMEAVGQLTGGVAHDFNNLLGVIIGNAEFLVDVVRDNPEHAALVEEILSGALSGADLTRRLLAFARRQPLQPRQVDLNAYLPNHVAILRRALGETITITTRLAGNLWLTRVDAPQIGDALLNLTINARDAMPHGGSIVIETANERVGQEYAAQNADLMAGDYVVLSVADTGVGMSPELLERAVEPFFTTKGPGAGSGLGLSMVYGFAQQSGGHLQIQSEVGRGTTVRLYLPRAQGEDTEPSAQAAAEPVPPRGDEIILLVDDNAEMRAIARRQLMTLGYRVVEAESSTEALQRLQNGECFDLLFTDIVMPDGLTGYQLAVAAQQLQPDLRVLYTTGYEGAVPRDDGAAPAGGSMLRKPYRQRELASTVHAVLGA